MESYHSHTLTPSVITYLLQKEIISLRFAIIGTYLIWFIFGLFGAHNFLLARYKIAIFQILIASIGVSIFPWGIPLLIIAGVIVLIDAFVIGPMIRLQQVILDEQKSEPRIINQ